MLQTEWEKGFEEGYYRARKEMLEGETMEKRLEEREPLPWEQYIHTKDGLILGLYNPHKGGRCYNSLGEESLKSQIEGEESE